MVNFKRVSKLAVFFVKMSAALFGLRVCLDFVFPPHRIGWRWALEDALALTAAAMLLARIFYGTKREKA